MKVEKLAKNGEKGQNCYPLSPIVEGRERSVNTRLASGLHQCKAGIVGTALLVSSALEAVEVDNFCFVTFEESLSDAILKGN